MTEPLLGVCESCLDEVPVFDLEDGTCPVCREAAAIDAEETAPPAPLSDLDRRILAMIGVRVGADQPPPWEPTIARSAAWIADRAGLDRGQVTARLLDLGERKLVVIIDHGGARLWRLTEAGCAALGRAPADALGAGSEVFGGSPPPVAPDPGAELRTENERLRAALKAARRAMVREVRELRHPDAGKREYDSAHRLEVAREAVDAVLLSVPSRRWQRCPIGSSQPA